MQEQLQNELKESSSENEAAFIKVFGKEHPGYVRGLGLGVTPSQITGCSSRSTASTSSSDANAKITRMQIEIDALKAQVAEVDVLKEQLDFLMQIAKGNQVY